MVSGQKKLIGVVLLSGCLWTGLAVQAEIYKWVDAEGVTVYSQQPPPAENDFETIKEPPKVNPESGLQRLHEISSRNDESRQERRQQAEAAKLAAEEEARRAENCERGKRMLASFSTRPTVQLVQEDGTRVRASEEQRQQQIAEANAMIKEFCD
jgi:hypothetical protein